MRRIEAQLANPCSEARTDPGHSPAPTSTSTTTDTSTTAAAPAGSQNNRHSPAARTNDKSEPGWLDRMVASLLAAVVQNLHVTVENLNVVVVCPLSLRCQHFGT